MRVDQWLKQIDQTAKQFKELCNELNIKQLNWKPNAETWSIAQNIDHLITINKTYFPIIEALRKDNYQRNAQEHPISEVESRGEFHHVFITVHSHQPRHLPPCDPCPSTTNPCPRNTMCDVPRGILAA